MKEINKLYFQLMSCLKSNDELMPQAILEALTLLSHELIKIKNINVDENRVVKEIGKRFNDEVRQNRDIVNHFADRFWKLSNVGKIQNIDHDKEFSFTPNYSFVFLIDKLFDMIESGDIDLNTKTK